jgi:DNA repair protein RadD
MLRDYQGLEQSQVFQAYHEGAIVVMPTMATGGGKTTLYVDSAVKFNCPAVAIAHRQELVSQGALAFNRERVPHGLIAQKKVIQQIIALEHEEHGYSCYSARAPVRVAGVDTLKNHDPKDRWLAQVGFGVIDEGHHVLRINKWGKELGKFPNARWMLPTAHAVRADNKGLGRLKGDGFVDRLVIGPYGRQLIDRGYLTDYRIICAKADIDFDSLEVGPSGDVSMPKLRALTHTSNTIVGNSAKLYMEYAAGKLGVTFVVDKEEATKTQAEFQKYGVPCGIITDDTPTTVRSALMKKFKARQILMLISVDCLGEGVDVPAIEVVIMARRTASWQLMCQQFGRGLRVMVDEAYAKLWDQYSDLERLAIIANSNKPKAIVIDLVGNIIWHAKFRGLPDSRQEYSLEAGERNARKSDAIPLRTCLECKQPYPSYLLKCPNPDPKKGNAICGAVPLPAGRATPEMVEGDVIELDPTVIRALLGEASRIMGPFIPNDYVAGFINTANLRRHHDAYSAQIALRHTMMIWGGWQKHLGLADREAHKLFYIRFGVDVLSAQAYPKSKAEELEARIRAELDLYQVREVAAA